MISTILTVLAPLVRHAEGLRLKAYQDPVGIWTIGYGHTRTAQKGLTITCQRAEELLKEDMTEAVQKTLELCPSLKLLDAAKIAAISDFTFNLGAGRLRASTLRRVIESGELDKVPAELRRWVYAKGRKLPGLVKRREDEVALWINGVLPDEERGQRSATGGCV